MNKLTPTFYVKRALKAKTVKELTDANMGLCALINSHVMYQTERWIDALFTTQRQLFSK